MGAEVDCLSERNEALDLKPESFLELKSVKHDAANIYRNQYPKWWLQSFLVGIRELRVGFRDDDRGTIQEIKELQVSSIPLLASEAGSPFDAVQALRFGEEVLSWMKAVASARPQVTIRFSYGQKNRMIVAKEVQKIE